jgi:hypothetical protein
MDDVALVEKVIKSELLPVQPLTKKNNNGSQKKKGSDCPPDHGKHRAQHDGVESSVRAALAAPSMPQRFTLSHSSSETECRDAQTTSPPPRKPHHVRPNTLGAGPGAGDKTCYRCGNTGHISRDSPVDGCMDGTECYKCGREGHIARYCQNDSPASSFQDGSQARVIWWSWWPHWHDLRSSSRLSSPHL